MAVATGITVTVPVKAWGSSKSRLDVQDVARERSRFFAFDVIDSVTPSALVGRLVLVTAERELRTATANKGATVIAGRPMMSSDDLSVAIDAGRRWAMMTCLPVRFLSCPSTWPP